MIKVTWAMKLVEDTRIAYRGLVFPDFPGACDGNLNLANHISEGITGES